MEGESQQARLDSDHHPVRDVKKGCFQQGAVGENPNAAALLDNKKSTVTGRGDIEGSGKAAGNGFQFDGGSGVS